VIRALTIAAAAAGIAWARRGGVRHVAVQGSSMQPTLRPGDRLFLLRLPGRARAGRLALTADPRDPGRELLKRIHATSRGETEVRGDNPAASTDSRVFGPVPADTVRTYVAWRYAPRDRTGLVQ
jgi:nickel-type superoxide dismutase maturation protease